MNVDLLAAWLLSIMLSASPPGRSRHPVEAIETADQGKARYAAIARAIATVSLDPNEAALFAGQDARAKTAALLLAISYHESHWRRHVDLGLGSRALGGGRYWCMMQIAVDRGKTPEGWTGKQLVQRRDRCFRRGLHILQRGKRFCRSRGGTSFINHYASGYCDRGGKAVALRTRTYREWLRARPIPKRAAAKPKRQRPRAPKGKR
ncbi:MAG: hypothetical protein JRI68_03325 [Deltaproteobacteria bacterium]|nr:hypothetical protein [Deltaproteobacteria bacterium]